MQDCIRHFYQLFGGWRRPLPHFLPLLLIMLLGSIPLLAPQPHPAVAAAPVTASQDLAAPADLNCDTSPFGDRLLLGGENEIFLSYQGGYGTVTDDWLHYNRLDINNNGVLSQQAEWLGGNSDSTLTDVSDIAGTAVDLNGDGRVEYVQAFTDANGAYHIVSHSDTAGVDAWTGPHNHHNRTAASGDLTRTGAGDEELVVASSNFSTGSLNVIMLNGDANGGISQDTFQYFGLWRTIEDNRDHPQKVSLAVGDLDGDGNDDEIVVAIFGNVSEIIVLEYTPGYQSGTGSNYKSNLKEIAAVSTPVSQALNIRLATGDIDGDFKEEIILAYDDEHIDEPQYSEQINIITYDFDEGTGGSDWEINERDTLTQNLFTDQLVLGAADTDRDGVAEIVLSYRALINSYWNLVVRTFDDLGGTVTEHSYWQNNANFRGEASHLSLAVGDVDKDSLMDVALGFLDAGDWIQVIYLTDTEQPAVGLQLKDTYRSGTEGRFNAGDISLSLVDWNNDSIKARYEPVTGTSLRCKTVVEPQISSAVFLPPYWVKMQGGQVGNFARINQSETGSSTQETAMTSSYSESVFGYIGAGAGGDLFGIGVETSVRATAGYEYNASLTFGGGSSSGQTLAQGIQGAEAFIVHENSTYHCYSYQLKENEQPIDGILRFCDFQEVEKQATELDSWDNNDGPLQGELAMTWVPIARDWSNRTLFLPAGNAVQSSTALGREASRAIDGNTDGILNNLVTQTAVEDFPWWQVDLGSTQDIGKVRVWHKSAGECAGLDTCFKVFVSNTDLRHISDDPAVLAADPRVTTYDYPQIGSRVTTFLTLAEQHQPIHGRYIRVQLLSTGALSLAEVQVFSGNYEEPDHYPLAVRDPDATTGPGGQTIPGTDGWFEALVYNPAAGQNEWVRLRGNLLWNTQPLDPFTVGSGNVGMDWSISEISGTHRLDASSYGHTTRYGIEFDFQAGAGVNVQVGGGTEIAEGVLHEESRIVSWEDEFGLGGGIQGFRPEFDGVPGIEACEYQYQPYLYEVTEESSFGFEHRFVVVDYIIPDGPLDRTADLEVCRQEEAGNGVNQIFLPLVVH